MKNIVVIGGGTGLSSMLSGMKKLEDVNLTAIITVADDGGSTGRIRELYNIPAVGDIRHVLAAMANDDSETLFRDLLNYRFGGNEDIGGHNLGNLIFLALMDSTGSFVGAIEAISKFLNVKGKIMPSTLDNVTLYATMSDGTLVRGEKNIPEVDNHIDHVHYQQDVIPHMQSIRAIERADLIMYGIGSLYTSIMPNLIIPEITEAIRKNNCPKIYFCNAMTQPGETTGYTVEDHIRAIEKHAYPGCVDVTVINDSRIPEETLEAYRKMGSSPVTLEQEVHEYIVIKRNLIMYDELGRVRHDPQKVLNVVKEIIDKM
ncbi:MAG: YvcK family protein [Firmicutes bacterium]|nr:YvcK family protein [Bacillota bacterium]